MTTRLMRPLPGYSLMLALLVGAGLTACAYRPFTGPLVPLNEQAPQLTVHDNGSVVYQLDRFEITVKPMTDAELNRQFSEASVSGNKSTNAYTYGNLEFVGPDSTKSRFAVFHVAVKNFSFPKVQVDPTRAVLEAGNGREYYSLTLAQLDTYYRAYARGYQGNEYARHRERIDLLRRTMLKADPVFSGQEAEGYIVFPVLHADVQDVRLILEDVVLRFDYRDEPTETTQVTYAFERLTGKQYADGRRVVTHTPGH